MEPRPVDRLEFIDAHHHLWDLQRNEYSWLMGAGWPEKTSDLGDYADIRRSYLVEDLLRDFSCCNVVKSVHLQADWTGPDPDPVGETRWLQGLADQTGFPHAIVAYTDLRAPDVEFQLTRHADSPNVRGIRMLVDAAILADSSFSRGCRALADLKLSFDLALTWELMGTARALADANPALSFILEHTGLPMERSPAYFGSWRLGMRELAGSSNVTVKISGLGTVDHHWTVDSLRPWVQETIEIFGPGRVMFGTNWPVDRLYSTYRALIDAYVALTASYSLDERTAMFSRNAERIYRI